MEPKRIELFTSTLQVSIAALGTCDPIFKNNLLRNLESNQDQVINSHPAQPPRVFRIKLFFNELLLFLVNLHEHLHEFLQLLRELLRLFRAFLQLLHLLRPLPS